MSNKPAICFIAHNAYGVLAKEDTSHAGGIEVQAPMIAKWFAAKGYPVSMITWDHGFEDGKTIEGVTVRKLCRKDEGLPILRFVWPRWTSFYGALSRAKADIYVSFCADMSLGQLAIWARPKRRAIVQNISSDADCTHELSNVTTGRDKFLYKLGLRRTNLVLTQTSTQSKLLAQNYALKSKVTPMACEGFAEAGMQFKSLNDGQSPRILWVGRYSKEKRLEWLLDLAEHRPDWQFDVVGAANEDTAYSQELVRRVAELGNVTKHGRLPHEKMAEMYRAATFLCCTSVYEGFPNVFLEAWSAGLPVVTTFDPDGIIANQGLGGYADSVEALDRSIAEVLEAEKYQGVSAACIAYYRQRHTVDAALGLMENAFLEISG